MKLALMNRCFIISMKSICIAFGLVVCLGISQSLAQTNVVSIYPKIPSQFLYNSNGIDRVVMGEPFYVDIYWDYTCPPSESMLGGGFDLIIYSINITNITKIPATGGVGRAVLPAPYNNVVMKNGFQDGTYWGLFGKPSDWPYAFYQGNFDGILPDIFGHAFAATNGYPGNRGPIAFYELHYQVNHPGTFCIDSVFTGDASFDWAFGNDIGMDIVAIAPGNPWCWEVGDSDSPPGDETPTSPITLFAEDDTQATPDVPSSYFCDEGALGIGDQNQMLTYVKFPISAIPTGVNVNSARLRFYTISPSDNVQVAVCPVTSGWNECDISWSSRPSLVSLTPCITTNPPGPYHWWEIDVTQMVNRWVALGEDRAFCLAKLSEGLTMVYSGESALRPELIVDFDLGEFAASGTVMSSSTGEGIQSVLMTFSRVSGTGAIPDPVAVSGLGTWWQSGFRIGTTYRVTPVNSNYVFTPTSQDFSSSGSSVTDLDFTAPTSYSVTITSNPSGAAIHRGSESNPIECLTPCTLQDLEGNELIYLTMTGYQTREYVLTRANAGSTINLSLTALSQIIFSIGREDFQYSDRPSQWAVRTFASYTPVTTLPGCLVTVPALGLSQVSDDPPHPGISSASFSIPPELLMTEFGLGMSLLQFCCAKDGYQTRCADAEVLLLSMPSPCDQSNMYFSPDENTVASYSFCQPPQNFPWECFRDNSPNDIRLQYDYKDTYRPWYPTSSDSVPRITPNGYLGYGLSNGLTDPEGSDWYYGNEDRGTLISRKGYSIDLEDFTFEFFYKSTVHDASCCLSVACSDMPLLKFGVIGSEIQVGAYGIPPIVVPAAQYQDGEWHHIVFQYEVTERDPWDPEYILAGTWALAVDDEVMVTGMVEGESFNLDLGDDSWLELSLAAINPNSVFIDEVRISDIARYDYVQEDYFIHISDLHVDASNNESVMRWNEAVSIFKNMNPAPAFVVASGDLVEAAYRLNGDPYEDNWNALLEPLSELNARYFIDENYTIEFITAPGNHDAKYADLMDNNFFAYSDYLGGTFETRHDLGTLFRVIITNGGMDDYDFPETPPPAAFCLPQGDGLKTVDMSALNTVLQGDPEPTYILIHHPVWNNGGRSETTLPSGETGKNLDGTFLNYHQEFINACVNNGVKAVLSGHVHSDVFDDVLHGVCNSAGEEWAHGNDPVFITTPALKDGYYRKIRFNSNGNILSIGNPISFESVINGWLCCATNVSIQDASGNSIVITDSGTIENNIPSAYFSHIESYIDGSIMTSTEFTLNRSDSIDYEIIIECINEEPLNIGILSNRIDTVFNRRDYWNVAVQQGSVAILKIESGSLEPEMIITDPDNSVRIIYPSESKGNQAPMLLDGITSPDTVYVDSIVSFSISSIDPEGEEVNYSFDWQEEGSGNWIGPFSSEAVVTIEHTWLTPGDYKVRVRAKDIWGNLGCWSEVKMISVISDFGDLSGYIIGTTGGLAGVPVNLVNSEGILVASVASDDSGFYNIPAIPKGTYSLSIVCPLGFNAEPETRDVQISGQPLRVDFELTKLENTPQQRTRGYWAFQAYKAFIDHPIDYTITDFGRFTGLIERHFNENTLNPVDFYTVHQPATATDSLNVLKTLLLMESTGGTEHFQNRYAKSELMSMMLNVVSGKISQTHPISEDGRTVSQAITYCDYLINGIPADLETIIQTSADSLWKYRRAIDVASKVNSGVLVSAGKIPEEILDIAYRQNLEVILPSEYSLGQNYPNPFNPTTTIEFSLPKASEVELEIFNIAGQKVATLVNTRLEAGNHTVTWDSRSTSGEPLASGIYLYRLKADTFVETKKMMLLK